MPRLFLVFNHILSAGQEEDARSSLGIDSIVSLPEELQGFWSGIPPEGPLPVRDLDGLAHWLIQNSSPGDFVLVQGDFGASFYLVDTCLKNRLVPVYSTTHRIYEQGNIGEAGMRNIHYFRHVNYRRYVRGRKITSPRR